MEMFTTWRIRVFSLVLVALALWQSFMAHAGIFHAPRGDLRVAALVLVWLASLFGMRKPALRPYALLLLLAASATLVRLTPGMGTFLVVTFGVYGARLPWRWLQVVGLPLVLAGAWWLNYPVAGGQLATLTDTGITLGIVLLLGRFVRDRDEVRAAQAQALADLQKAHAELQTYTAQVEELSTLRERSRLARELHDTLGHALSAITVQLEAARRLHRRDPAAIDPMLVETQGLARQAMQQLRQYLAGLRLDGAARDLLPTLEALAREAASRNGWRLTLQLAPVALPDPTQQALLQIAREALTNIERHAQAQAVAVRLYGEGEHAVLSIADDGQGFEPGQERSGHFGLQGMRERLAELHGELHVQSSPGQGSQVIARLPAPAPVAHP